MLRPITENRQDFDNIDYLNLSNNRTHTQGMKKKNTSLLGTSLSCVGVLWAFLSLVSLGLSLISLFLPYWIKGTLKINAFSYTQQETGLNNLTDTYFGLWRRCNYYVMTSDGSVDVSRVCGRYSTFFDIPSVWWQIAAVLTVVGCVLSMFVTCLALLACCVSNVMSNSLAKTTSVIQFFAALCLATGCVLYPFGWENNLELQQACGPNISVYHLDGCSISWCYWVAVSGAGLCIMCSLLACFSAKKKTRLRYDRVGL